MQFGPKSFGLHCVGPLCRVPPPHPFRGHRSRGRTYQALRESQHLRQSRNSSDRAALLGMFFFFSNAVGLASSILVSVLLTLLLLYACNAA